MHDAVPSCFRGGAAEAAAPPASCTQARPRVTTSVYETRLGAAAALTWYRTALGLSLHVDLLLPPSPAATSPSCSSTSSVISSDEKTGTVRFRLRPWLLWKRRGTKRFYLKGGEHQERSSHRTVVDFAWDLACARFSPGGGPEPAARFFVAVAVDGEMFLVVGDMEAEAHKKTRTEHAVLCSATLVSRTEHAVLPSSGRSSYTTRASLGGKEREICIDLQGGEEEEGGRDAYKLSVALDGGSVLDVKRLQWKFRGSEEVEVDGGAARVQVSWDVHRWLFGRRLCPLPPASAAATSSSEPGHAVLLLRFDREEPEQEEEGDVEACPGKHRRGGGGGGWFRGGAVEDSRKSGRTRSLLKTRSSSSSSSASSSGSGSSVMEWASAEDVDQQESDTFSLVVNLWKG